MCQSALKSVCIIGSGNWGTTISKLIGLNAPRIPNFDQTVKMYVMEEMVNGKKLTEIINETHENVKYLPGIKLPCNVLAVPNIIDAAKEADFLVFVLPHQFLEATCKSLNGNIKPTAVGLSLIKGFDVAPGGGLALISHIIIRELNIPCAVLMGANLATEISQNKFSETTIGCKDLKVGEVWKELIQSDNFRVSVIDDEDTVEICGALKNIVACAAGFVDGMELGDNTKAAIIRLGFIEMIDFTEIFYKGRKMQTFLESCGIADVIATCYGGRNRKISEAFVRTGKPIRELEESMLNGQKVQGPPTAAEVNFMLRTNKIEDRFPLFTAVHKICIGELKVTQLIDCIRHHPANDSKDPKKSYF